MKTALQFQADTTQLQLKAAPSEVSTAFEHTGVRAWLKQYSIKPVTYQHRCDQHRCGDIGSRRVAQI